MEMIDEKNQMDTYKLTVLGRDVIVAPHSKNDDQFYKVYEKGKFLFNLRLNESGIWYAYNQHEDPSAAPDIIDDDFADAIGSSLEQNDL